MVAAEDLKERERQAEEEEEEEVSGGYVAALALCSA